MKSSWSRSALFGFISWLMPLGLTLFATPLVVRHLGFEEYGLYVLVLGFISYSFTFSIGRAVTKYVSEYRASEQNEKIKEVLAATLWINFTVGLLGIFTLCFFARSIVVSLFEIKPEMQENAVIAFYIASATIFFVMQAQIFSGVLQAVHRLDVFSIITTIVSVLGVSGNIVIVLLGFEVKELLVWNLLNTTLSCIWFYLAGKRILPEAKWRLRCSREVLKTVAKFALGITASQLIFNFLLLFERGLITRELGTENLTYYVIPMNLTGQIHIFSSSLLLMIFPLASELGARLEIERLRMIYEQTSRYLFAIVSFIVVSMTICGYEFFSLWLGPEFADRTFYIVIMQTVTFGSIAVGIVAWQLMEGLGYTQNNAFVAIVWVALSLLLMIMLIPSLKLDGVGLGRMFGCISMLIYMLVVEKKIFGKTLWSFWRRVLFLIALPVFVTAAIEYSSLRYLLGGWFGLCIACSFGAAVYASLLFATKYLTFEDRLILQKILLKVYPRFS
ncbi:MAG: oligosaccharide flippase family protein [Acidobacteriota bacterium]|nr:oligosaccharide flippase family protein [Acidobacteriota bacterium]